MYEYTQKKVSKEPGVLAPAKPLGRFIKMEHNGVVVK